MNSLLRYATPFTTGLFLISLVSGIALFFHVGTSYFREMHELLSLVLVLPFILHLVRNWRAFVNYFRRAPMLVALGLSLIVAAGFAYQGANTTGGNPAMATIQALEKAPVSAVAPIFGETPDAMAARLRDAGFTVASTGDTLSAIATASGKDSFALIAAVTAKP